MGSTLLEMAKTYKDPLARGVVTLFAETSPVLERITFETIQGGGYKYDQEESLPGIGFRGVNEGWEPSIGVMNPQFEPLVIAGGELDVDNHILRTQGEGRRAGETARKVKALALKWQAVFFKGDALTNPRQFDGLQNRLVGRQRLPAGATAGGDALSLFLLDELISLVEGPNKVLSMNRRMRLRMSQAARNSSVGGYVTFTTDSFGREVMNWNGVPILEATQDEANLDVLPFSEACNGGGSNVGTSIYCVSLADGYTYGIQNSSPIVNDLGEMETKPAHRTRVEWDLGLVVEHPRGAARLDSIKDAAIVA